MKVNYKPGSIYSNPADFPFKEDDYVTIVVRFWVKKAEDESSLYYHGVITEFDEEQDGFWAVLDDDPEREEFFHFGDLEAVISGERIPSLAGTKKRLASDYQDSKSDG
ncbi:hypothetical protein [Bacillus infantis]|uniref:hypothetical protein n=1 Tax=Bacillus infantis TaxID=324767 RepID=UPI003CE6973E